MTFRVQFLNTVICVLQEQWVSPGQSVQKFLNLAFCLCKGNAGGSQFRVIALFLSAFQRVEFLHLLNHLAVHKRLHVLRCQRTSPLTAPVFRPLFAPQVGNAILGSQSCQRIATAPALDFPGQPGIMAFTAILERGVL